MSTIIKFKLLYPDSKPPVRAVIGDAGWDLSVRDFDTIGQVRMYKTGVAVEIPSGYFGLLRPRSSICKTSYVFVSSGVIDSGYRGEIGVPMRWIDSTDTTLVPGIGDRIAQLIILPLPDVTFVQVGALSDTLRGENGFGSTGK